MKRATIPMYVHIYICVYIYKYVYIYIFLRRALVEGLRGFMVNTLQKLEDVGYTFEGLEHEGVVSWLRIKNAAQSWGMIFFADCFLSSGSGVKAQGSRFWKRACSPKAQNSWLASFGLCRGR